MKGLLIIAMGVGTCDTIPGNIAEIIQYGSELYAWVLGQTEEDKIHQRVNEREMLVSMSMLDL